MQKRLIAVLVALVLCVGYAWSGGGAESPESNTAASGAKESPMLTARVEAGELPPLGGTASCKSVCGRPR